MTQAISEKEWGEILKDLREDDLFMQPKEWTEEEREELRNEMREFMARRQALVNQGYSSEEAERLLDKYFKTVANGIIDGYNPYAPYPREEPHEMAVAETTAEYKP
jgi:Holliday junction resolvasome RuvABC DNA-binding subunit